MRILAHEDDQEQNAKNKPLREVSLAKIEDGACKIVCEDSPVVRIACDVAVLQRHQNRAHGEVEGGQQCKPDGANQQAERIEQCRSPSNRRTQQSRPAMQHDIFDGLPALVAVRFDALLAALSFGAHIAEQMLQRAHGADPSAEEAAQKERWHAE